MSGPNSLPCDPCKELSDLENIMARLVKRQSELKRNINRTHSLLICRIPPEIIAKISGFTTTDSAIRLPSALILLTSICSDWRQIVVGTPELWSSIKIDLPFVSESQTHDMVYGKVLRLATLIDEWLARSGRLPLHISLGISSRCDASEIADANTPEKYHPIFMILNRYSARWRSLNISIPPTLFSCLQPDCLSLLEQLHVNVEFQEDQTGVHKHMLTFPPSPHLKAVGIAKTSMTFDVALSLPNQWDNVTHVSAAWLTVPESLKLLRLIPQLLHCELHNIVGSISVNGDLGPPVIGPLTYLYLSWSQLRSQRSFCRLFDNLILPSLETLVLSHVTLMDPITAFLERSACSLHTLSLEGLEIRPFNDLIRLLKFLSPSLKYLTVTDGFNLHDTNQQYLSILSKTYSSQSVTTRNDDDFLPHLESFEYNSTFLPSNSTTTISLPNLTTQNYPKLSTFIPLRSVSINLGTISEPIPQDILSCLQRLNEDGIMVTLRCVEL